MRARTLILYSAILFSALFCCTSEAALAQTADRTIDEIKSETLARAQTGAYPALGITPGDASDALGGVSRITFQMSSASLETAAMKRSIELLGTDVAAIVRAHPSAYPVHR